MTRPTGVPAVRGAFDAYVVTAFEALGGRLAVARSRYGIAVRG